MVDTHCIKCNKEFRIPDDGGELIGSHPDDPYAYETAGESPNKHIIGFICKECYDARQAKVTRTSTRHLA